MVIAESTRKLMGNLFELEDLGAQDLKGIAGPVGAWAALRPASVESRFEAFHASGLTELVGREEELELLLRRWSKAKGGEGQWRSIASCRRPCCTARARASETTRRGVPIPHFDRPRW